MERIVELGCVGCSCCNCINQFSNSKLGVSFYTIGSIMMMLSAAVAM